MPQVPKFPLVYQRAAGPPSFAVPRVTEKRAKEVEAFCHQVIVDLGLPAALSDSETGTVRGFCNLADPQLFRVAESIIISYPGQVPAGLDSKEFLAQGHDQGPAFRVSSALNNAATATATAYTYRDGMIGCQFSYFMGALREGAAVQGASAEALQAFAALDPAWQRVLTQRDAAAAQNQRLVADATAQKDEALSQLRQANTELEALRAEVRRLNAALAQAQGTTLRATPAPEDQRKSSR